MTLAICLDRIEGVITEIQPVIKKLMVLKNEQDSGGRENFMSFAIIERLYYNVMGAHPLVLQFRHNHNMALPLSHIFRSIIYEIVVAYWLLDEDFKKRLAVLNSDFIIQNSKRLKNLPDQEVDMQHIYMGWMTISPENFTLKELDNGDGELSINPEYKPTQFSKICEGVIGKYKDVHSLSMCYAVLSQQAHLSEFSRELIYERYVSNATLFDSVCQSIITASSLLANKIGCPVETTEAYSNLLNKYFPGSYMTDKPVQA